MELSKYTNDTEVYVMAVVKELIRNEKDGSLSFGDYTLNEKTKLSDFEHSGDLYKIKTYNEITKLEKNGLFVYESVPGTAVHNFNASDSTISFKVEGAEDAQITLELEADTTYSIVVNGENTGSMKTNLGGKLMFSVELDKDNLSEVEINRI